MGQNSNPAGPAPSRLVSTTQTLPKYRAFLEELADNREFYDYFKENPREAFGQFHMDLPERFVREGIHPPSQEEIRSKLQGVRDDDGFNKVRTALDLPFSGCGFIPPVPTTSGGSGP